MSALCLIGCASTSPGLDSQDFAALESIRDSFIAHMEQSGLTLPYVPGVKEWTRPSLISWRREARTVAIPKWDELLPEQKTLISTIAGDSIDPKKLFDLLFRWLLVPHELTHAYQDQYGASDNPALSERFANDMAVAFYVEQQDSEVRLAALERVLKQAQKRLPAPLDDAVFNSRYQNMDAQTYASNQVRLITDSLRRRHSLVFSRLIDELPLTLRSHRPIPLSMQLLPLEDATALPPSARPANDIAIQREPIAADRLAALKEVVLDLNKRGNPLLNAAFAGILPKTPMKVNVIALAGAPSPYDAWCAPYAGTQTVFINLSLWDVSRIQTRGRPLVVHEITHFLLHQLNRPAPKTPIEALQDIVFDEGIAHFIGRPDSHLSMLVTRQTERQTAEKALAHAKLRLQSPHATPTEIELLLRRANTGPYWEKYAAIAGMFQVADLYRTKGTQGLRDFISGKEPRREPKNQNR